MTDRYQELVNTPAGRLIAKRVGLPRPPVLDRYVLGRPVIAGPVLLAAPHDGRLAPALTAILAAIGAEVLTPMDPPLRRAVADAGLPAQLFNPDAVTKSQRFKALVLDATGLVSSEQLEQAYAFLAPVVRRVKSSGRVLVLGTPPEECDQLEAAIAQRALEGLVRSLAKELRGGATAQLISVSPGAEHQLESTVRFLLSPRSAFVDGQVVRVGKAVAPPVKLNWEAPLDDRVALVTGAARGIGAEIASVLARDGARVVGLDVESMAAELDGVMGRLGGTALTVDITDPAAPEAIAEQLVSAHGGVDVVVHNAGVTRDKTLGRMTEDQWRTVIAINLTAPQRIDAALLERRAIQRNGRVVCVSSISGIAGNAGQTNYATSKAGVIGLVQASAPVFAEHEITINAVAPGFIETQMTKAIPLGIREAGRRLSTLRQGGLPVDVAETVAWLASPASGAITGSVVRVCGQSLIGA